jgi:hypothetical protein
MKIQTTLTTHPTKFQDLLWKLNLWSPNVITITIDTEHMSEAKLTSTKPTMLKHEFTTYAPSKKITLKGERCPRGASTADPYTK